MMERRLTLDEKIRQGRLTRRDFLELTGKGLGAVALSQLIGCQSANPDGPGTKYSHKLRVMCQTLHSGSSVTGTVDVLFHSDGKTYTGPIGQDIVLPTTETKTENCDVLIKAAGCVEREYTYLGITDNDLDTNVVHPNEMDMNFAIYIMPDGINRAFAAKKFDVYFNPDPLTGLRLDTAYIDSIEQTLQDVASNSKGWIQSVSFNELGNKPADATVPPDGEIWVYRRSDVSGISNVTYPLTLEKVLSSKMSINQADAGPDRCPSETYDALFGGGQEFGSGANVIPFFTFVLKRPRDTNSYRLISAQRETQRGQDSQTTMMNYQQMKSF